MTSLSIRNSEKDYDIISEVPSSDADTTHGIVKLTSNEALEQVYSNETLPPQASDGEVTFPDTSDNGCGTCCCLYARGDAVPTSSLGENNQTSNQSCCITAPRRLRKLLSSIGIYCYVLVVTFVVVFLLLAELLLDLRVIVVPDIHIADTDSETTTQTQPTLQNGISNQSRIIFIVHWINFSILCLFTLEVLLRVYAWKVNIIRHVTPLWDSAAVIVAFASNIVTTIAAGYGSPFNAISLIIVFRFVRVYSLIQCFVLKTKHEYKEKLAKAERFQTELQVNSQRLIRQISEKDYEIKQLRAHLGGNDKDLKKDLAQSSCSKMKKTDHYDSELEQVLAISKKEYEKENGGGYVNPAYTSQSTDNKIPEITVHHRENSIRRNVFDKPSTSKDGLILGENVDSLQHETQPTSGGLTFGQLHSGAETDSRGSTADTSLLLHNNNSNNSNNKQWSVGYCLVQEQTSGLDKDVALFDRVTQSDSKALQKILKNTNETSEKMSSDTSSSHSDEGFGNGSSTSSRNFDYNQNHKRSCSGVVSSSVDETLSDQGCVSTSSICSESGYQSDDRPALSITSSPKMELACDEEDADVVSINTVLSNPHSTRTSSASPINFELTDIHDKSDASARDDVIEQEDQL